MKGSAVDFLTKSVVEEALLASVDRALLQGRTNRKDAVDNVMLLIRMSDLETPRN
jgi:FixJ family two-component response regulator